MSHFTSYTEYLIDRRFNSNRFLFTFTPVACSIFNFNEKAIRRQVLIRFVDRSVYRGLLFGPPRMLPHWTGVVHGHAAGATSLESSWQRLRLSAVSRLPRVAFHRVNPLNTTIAAPHKRSSLTRLCRSCISHTAQYKRNFTVVLLSS